VEQRDQKHVGIFSNILIYYFRLIHTSLWFVTYFLYTSFQRHFTSTGIFYRYHLWLIALENLVLFLIFRYNRSLAFWLKKLYFTLVYGRLSLLKDQVALALKKARNDFALFSVSLLSHWLFSLFTYPYSRILTDLHVPYADINVNSKHGSDFPYSDFAPSAMEIFRQFYSGDIGDVLIEFSVLICVILVHFILIKVLYNGLVKKGFSFLISNEPIWQIENGQNVRQDKESEKLIGSTTEEEEKEEPWDEHFLSFVIIGYLIIGIIVLIANYH